MICAVSTGHTCRERMATVTLFLCCLLGSVSLVYGQTLGELICSATSFNITVRNLVLLSSL